jgi:hypothetical protein
VTEPFARIGAVDAESQCGELAARWEIWRKEKAPRRAHPPECGVNYATVFAAMTRLRRI